MKIVVWKNEIITTKLYQLSQRGILFFSSLTIKKKLLEKLALIMKKFKNSLEHS